MTGRGKQFVTALAVMASILVFAACGSDDDGGSGDGGGDTIKVGLSGALTGGDAILGQTQREGVQLAVNEINDSGGVDGKQIELVTEDEANDPSRMAQIAQKFVTQDQVDVIIGGTNDGTAQVLAQVAADSEVPLVVPFANGDQITQDNPWAFQVDVASTAFVQAAIDYMAEKYDKIGIAYDNNAFGQADRDFAVEDLAEKNMEPVAEVSMPDSAGDYTAQLSEMRDADAQALFTPMSGTNVAQLRKDMIRLNYQPEVVGPNSLAFQSMIDIGGQNVERSVRLYDVIDEDKPAVAEFTRKFQEAYDKEPTSGFELLGYDAMNILAEALQGTDGDKTAVRDNLESLSGFEAVSGAEGSTISYSPNDHRRPSPDDLVLRWVVDGQFQNAPTK